ncbi:MAG: glycosyltransferase family protein [Actinomycetota bacterium]
MKRLLMYSQDGMGLGHLRRSSNIAQEILLRAPKTDVLILADSPATSLIAPRPGIEVMKLPTIIKTGSGSWKSTAWKNSSLSSDIKRIMRLRAKLILETFSEFAPDTVLVDHMPVGALGELKPMLERSMSLRRPPKLFLGLRDILDSPSVIRRVWAKLGAYEILRLYEAVLIYGSRQIYDASLAYGLKPSARNVLFCNYVSPVAQQQATESVLDEPYILMMGGGGRDAYPLALTFLDAFPLLSPQLPMRAVVLTGPNMLAGDREALVAHAATPVVVKGGYSNADMWIRNADAVVSLAGYNSLCEVLKWRRKALVVPRSGPSAEQRTRGDLFSRRSLIRVLDPTELVPVRLAEELLALLADGAVPNPANIPPLDGAQHSSMAMLEGIESVPQQIATEPTVTDDPGAPPSDPSIEGHYDRLAGSSNGLSLAGQAEVGVARSQ